MSEITPLINHDYGKMRRLHNVAIGILRAAGTPSKDGTADVFLGEVAGISALPEQITNHFHVDACDEKEEKITPTKTLLQIARRRREYLSRHSGIESIVSIGVVRHELAALPRVLRITYGSTLFEDFTANLHRSLEGRVENKAE